MLALSSKLFDRNHWLICSHGKYFVQKTNKRTQSHANTPNTFTLTNCCKKNCNKNTKIDKESQMMMKPNNVKRKIIKFHTLDRQPKKSG